MPVRGASWWWSWCEGLVLRWRLLRMRGGGGTGPGRGWGAPSRTRRRCWPAEEEEEEEEEEEGAPPLPLPLPLPWAPAGAALLLLLLLALAPLCPALALALALASGLVLAAGGAWAARRERAPRAIPRRKGAPLANGGPPLAAGRNEGGRSGRRRLSREGLTPPPPPPPPPFVLPPPRRRYPIHQAQYASLGTLPSICWDSYGRKSRLLAHNSSMVQSPMTVKIARPDGYVGHSSLLEQLSSPAAFSPASNSTLDPCAKETVLSALKESRKRVVEEEEEDYRSFLGGQESKRRRRDSGGSGQSAFEPLVANGAPACLVPKPGSLKRGLLSSHGSEESCSKRSRTSSLSSLNSLSVGGIPSSIRNAIASSYSSTRGLSQLWKRSGPSASPLSSSTSPHSQTLERPNKKVRYPNSSLLEEEDSFKTSTSTPLKTDKEVQAEKAAEMALQSGLSPQASLPSSGSDGTRKRKIQLLSTLRGDHLTLPPPPQLGYPVTSEDLDAEKEAALQLFNKVLEDKTDSDPSPPAEVAVSSSSSSSSVPSPLTFSLALPAKPPGLLPPSTAAAANPLLESLKKMQDAQSTIGQADPGANSSSSNTAETPPLPPASASLPLGTSTPVTSGERAAEPLPLGSPHSLTSTAALPPSPLLPPLPAAASGAAQPACEGSAPVTSSSSSSELSQTPARPSAPKPSILFGILTSPPDSQPLAGASSATTTPSTLPAATASPVFKPIFGALAKSESSSLSSAGSTSETFSVSPGTLPSVAPSLAPGPGTFKPIFGGLPISTTTAASSSFTFHPASTPASTASSAAVSSIPEFPAPSGAGAAATSTLASLLSTTAGITTVSVSKPVFNFRTGLQALGGGGGMATPAAVAVASSGIVPPATLPSQPLLFGAPSTTTGGIAAAPLFQFGKLAATQGATLAPLGGSASSTTTQAAPSTTATAPGGFNIFSSSSGSSSLALTAPSVAPMTTMPATITAGSQPSLTFGLGPSAFGGGFGTASKGPPPPYSAEPSQLTFEAGALEGQPPAAKPSTGLVTFGTPFSFTGSVVQPATQLAFGAGASSGGPQPAFGGPGPLVSFGAKSASQPAFGSSTSVFSFGAATTAAATSFGSSTQTTASSGGSSAGAASVFGGPAPAPFAFGASSQPTVTGAGGSTFGIGTAGSAAGTGVPSVGFSFGGGQSTGTGAATPFGSSLATNPLGISAQSSSFAFSITGTSESKPAFGGAPTPTFGQSTPAASAAASGAALGASTLSFGTPVTPAFGGAGPAFSPSVPSFSIGAGAKTGPRQRLQARRQHTRKK